MLEAFLRKNYLPDLQLFESKTSPWASSYETFNPLRIFNPFYIYFYDSWKCHKIFWRFQGM